MTAELPQLSPVQKAIDSLARCLRPVSPEGVDPPSAIGRILAETLCSDRDSPALDVSAMDGYALRLEDYTDGQPLTIHSTIAAGHEPTPLPIGKCMRVFTGAGIPQGADCVVPREQTDEQPAQVTLHTRPNLGQHIRRRGENSRQGDHVLECGTIVNEATVGALASFTSDKLRVFQKVRVTVLNTGDEIKQMAEPVAAWEIRDSNGPTLEAWLSKLSWAELVRRRTVRDTLADVEHAIQEALPESDAVILTGGVSMGDADFVPEAVRNCGGEIIFHRLPIRPGKPVLGAVIDRKPVMGLPGNPVSVAVTARVIAQPLLETIGGKNATSRYAQAELASADDRSLQLYWHRLVKINAQSRLVLTEGKGSGDLVALAHSDGFVILPPGASGPGPWPFVPW